MTTRQPAHKSVIWAARIALIIVFVINVQCAIQFIAWPHLFAPAYQVSGIPGSVAIQGLGVAFLMWNATYPIAIINPDKYRIVFAIVLVQQGIGLIGETLIYCGIPAGYELLTSSILRFIAFDAAGLLLMGITGIALLISRKQKQTTSQPPARDA